jgi:Ca2+-binding EF-hand superfamily protein
VLLEQEFNEAHSKRITERAQQGYAMRGLENMHQFAEFDADGDGKVTLEEFTAAQSTHRPPMQQ